MNPQRKCIGCNKITDKNMLLRVVCIDGEPEIDIDKVLPGRGCYVCSNQKCIEQAIKKRAFSRALRTDISNEALGRCFNDRK